MVPGKSIRNPKSGAATTRAESPAQSSLDPREAGGDGRRIRAITVHRTDEILLVGRSESEAKQVLSACVELSPGTSIQP